MPTVEAMACGTPVIVYDATALPEVVTSKTGFIVEPHDLKSVCDTIASKRLAEITNKDCIEQAKRFEKNRQYKLYLNLYESMIKGRS